MIKYIGSKRLLIQHIVEAISAFPESHRVLDLFSGTSRIGHAVKKTGRFVISNDHLTYAHTLARCYVQADATVRQQEAEQLIDSLQHTPPVEGYFTKTFCENARFFQPKNGARVDGIREEIDARSLDPELKAIALTSLMEAADRVDSTTGVQMAYLKKWAARSHNDLQLRVPDLLPGDGLALQMEAVNAAREVEADVAYLDPPYNQHSYMGNYHVWESLVRWDKPEAYGVAQKRIQCREYKSAFNSKPRIAEAMREVVHAVTAPHLLVSFSNEGYLSRENLEALLQERGHVGVVAVDFDRYVGSKIGIYNPSGKKVGRVSHVRNKEFLFVVSEKQAVVDQVVGRLKALAPE